MRFLGIFSNNLDEFFRVRFAAIRRLTLTGFAGEKYFNGISANQLLHDITEIVINQQAESIDILNDIEARLEKENIFTIDENDVTVEQEQYLKDFFVQKVSPELVTIILNDLDHFPVLKDTSGYLAIKLVINNGEVEPKGTAFNLKSLLKNKSNLSNKEILYAVIEIPKTINRFVVLPPEGEKQFVIMLDDVIRLNLNKIFDIFDYESVSAHMIKITRDAQLDIDSDLSKSMLEKIASSVKDRRIGEPVRFIYDQTIEKDTLNFFLTNMKIDATDSIIPGGKYHNRRDYMDFPNLGRFDLLYKTNPPLPLPGLSLDENIMKKIAVKDYLVSAPYQSYSYVIKFLREAALDPEVTSIKITLYRLAKNSQIISSLINAAKNGKKVTVQIELQARFDEASNIFYSEQMQMEGIELIFGVKGLKVHSKICVIERIEGSKIKRYGIISTGNFNESTAKVYTDVTLFTAHQKILKDVAKVFDFFEINYRIYNYRHIIASPHYMRSNFNKLINKEIAHAKAGKQTYLKFKMNSLSDIEMIDKLYEANNAGVKIQLEVRGICSLIPGIPGMSENIEAISIVDNYLEHSRIYIFGNAGNPQVFISSADLMTRNIDGRVEVTCPIYDNDIKNELIDNFDLGWQGNVKARLHSHKLDNKYRQRGNKPIFRAQLETYNYYKNKLEQ
jgi:polyphosphate kinase